MRHHKTFVQVQFLLLCIFLVIVPAQCTYSNNGYRLQPISGADGVLETVNIDRVTVYRTVKNNGSYHPYMYFRLPGETR